jgi:transposase
MLTQMTEEDWAITLEVFDAAQSIRGEPGRDDRKFLEAIQYFTVHNITWRALPAEFGKWNGSVAKSGIDGVQAARRSRRITSGGNPE